MAHGIQVFDASSNIMMDSDMKLMRVIATVNYPSLAGGASYTYYHALITANCVPLLFSFYNYAVCYSGYVTITNGLPSYLTAPSGSFTIVKGVQ